MRRDVLCWTVVLILTASVAQAAKPPRRLGVTVGTTDVTIERATAGGKVVLVGYELFRRDFSPVYLRVYRAATADSNRTVRFELGRDIEPKSFWVAFDVASGAYGAESSAKQKLLEAELPDEAFQKDANKKRRKIEARLDYVYALVIRPGNGVWELTAGDGGPTDDDGAFDGKIHLVAGQMKGIAKTAAALDDFQDGDVIAIFAPHRMAYLVTEVKK
jgi:hypothetical protein